MPVEVDTTQVALVNEVDGELMLFDTEADADQYALSEDEALVRGTIPTHEEGHDGRIH